MEVRACYPWKVTMCQPQQETLWRGEQRRGTAPAPYSHLHQLSTCTSHSLSLDTALPHCMTRPRIAVPPLQQLSTSTSQCVALGGRAALASPFLPPSLAFTPCTPGSTCSFVDCNAERQHFLAKYWVLPSLSLQVMCTLLHVALLVSSLSY